MLKSRIDIPFDKCIASNFDCSERTAYEWKLSKKRVLIVVIPGRQSGR